MLNKSIKLSLSNTTLVVASLKVACLAASKNEVIWMGTLLEVMDWTTKPWLKIVHPSWVSEKE
jgi:hypothetical protein